MNLLKAALIFLIIVGIFACGEARKESDLGGAPPSDSASLERIAELKENGVAFITYKQLIELIGLENMFRPEDSAY